MGAGGILVTHSAVLAWDNNQKAAKWHQESTQVFVPSPLTWMPAEKSSKDSESYEDSRPKNHTRIGTLRIPSVGAEIPVWEGVSEQDLERGAGRHRSLGLAGEGSTTMVLAGHIETAFRHLPNVRPGDQIIYTSKDGRTFTYTMTKNWVTSPDDRTVVRNAANADLRLYTCYGTHNQKRYVVQAQLTND